MMDSSSTAARRRQQQQQQPSTSNRSGSSDGGDDDDINNNNDDDSDRAAHRETSYEIPALHQTQQQHAARHQRQAAASLFPSNHVDDDTSMHGFMSEPSVSEDGGDASSGNFVRAPHRVILTTTPMGSGMRGRIPSSSDDEEYQRRGAGGGTNNPRRRGGDGGANEYARRQLAVPNSPGNTSLSSWDANSTTSPAAKKHFLFHFLPERVVGEGGGGGSGSGASSAARQQQQPQPQPRSRAHHRRTGNASSEGSGTRRPRAGGISPSATGVIFGSPLIAPRAATQAATHTPEGAQVPTQVPTQQRPSRWRQLRHGNHHGSRPGLGPFRHMVGQQRPSEEEEGDGIGSPVPSPEEQLVPLKDPSEEPLRRFRAVHHDGAAAAVAEQIYSPTTTVPDDPLPPDYVLSPGSSTQEASHSHPPTLPCADESIAMTLSEDSDPGGAGPDGDEDDDHHHNQPANDEDGDGGGGPSKFLLLIRQWEGQDHSADDEQTDLRPPRAKRRATTAIPGHKRTRSGDAAAATLATGGSWRGMELDRIPLPRPVKEDDDDDSNEGAGPSAPTLRHGRPGRPPKHPSGSFGHHDEHSSARDTLWTDQHEASMLMHQSHTRYPLGSYGTSEYHPFWHPTSDFTSQESQAPWGFVANQPLSGVSYQSPDVAAWRSFALPPGVPVFPQTDPTQTSPSEDTFVRVDYDDQMFGRSAGVVEGSEGDSSGEFIGPAALEELERTLEENQGFRNIFGQAYARPPENPFANFTKKSAEKAPRRMFLPQTFVLDDDNKMYRFYNCPYCGTRQREFFTVSSAPSQDSGPSSYLALYFALYVTASLFIFGLEEGWEPLDCIYFAVITLTTTGLGDKVPTNAGSKIICSIFIYFGVACIGLLLGTYIAGLLDDKASRDRLSKRAESCQTCKQVQSLRETTSRRNSYTASLRGSLDSGRPKVQRFYSERRTGLSHDIGNIGTSTGSRRLKKGTLVRSSQVDDGVLLSTYGINQAQSSAGPNFTNQLPGDMATLPNTTSIGTPPNTAPIGTPPNSSSVRRSPPLSHSVSSDSPQSQSILSPVTRRILGRQGHTRHQSIDLTHTGVFGSIPAAPAAVIHRPVTTPVDLRPQRQPLDDPIRSHNSADNLLNPSSENASGAKQKKFGTRTYSGYFTDGGDDSSSDGSSSTESTIVDIMDEKTFRLRAAKYVFITLRQALVNSLVIIAIGSIGFWYIEGFALVDSWYFSTVLLTTTGYGDIIPTSRGGKLFATIYLLVAGTILLNNMSLISMIPLELRRRRIERAVLTQFGDQLDDAALRELATGPLVQRLHLSANRPDGLDECTREMFSLAMLVRLGKVTEDEIKETFAAFRRLDVNNEGVLNSKSIIAALIQQKRSKHEPHLPPGSLSQQVPPSSVPQQGPPPPAPSLPNPAPVVVTFPTVDPPPPPTFPVFGDQQPEQQFLLPPREWRLPQYNRFDPALSHYLPYANGESSSVHYSSGSSRSRKQGNSSAISASVNSPRDE